MLPQHEPCEPIGPGGAPIAAKVRRESSLAVYCGGDQQVSDGFATALRIMGLDASFPRVGIALAANTPNTEDN
jgi:hypothetical protein